MTAEELPKRQMKWVKERSNTTTYLGQSKMIESSTENGVTRLCYIDLATSPHKGTTTDITFSYPPNGM